MKALIVAAAVAHAVSAPLMVHMAGCESTWNPRAISPDGVNVGLYQLSRYGELPGFIAWAQAQGLVPDPLDPAQQANFTAERLAAGAGPAWACWWLVG